MLKQLATVPAATRPEARRLAAGSRNQSGRARGLRRRLVRLPRPTARRVQLLARSHGRRSFVDAQIPGLRDWWVGRGYAAVRRAKRPVRRDRESPSRTDLATIRSPAADHPRRPGAADAAGVPARMSRQGEPCHVHAMAMSMLTLRRRSPKRRLRQAAVESPFDSEAPPIRANDRDLICLRSTSRRTALCRMVVMTTPARIVQDVPDQPLEPDGARAVPRLPGSAGPAGSRTPAPRQGRSLRRRAANPARGPSGLLEQPRADANARGSRRLAAVDPEPQSGGCPPQADGPQA